MLILLAEMKNILDQFLFSMRSIQQQQNSKTSEMMKLSFICSR